MLELNWINDTYIDEITKPAVFVAYCYIVRNTVHFLTGVQQLIPLGGGGGEVWQGPAAPPPLADRNITKQSYCTVYKYMTCMCGTT